MCEMAQYFVTNYSIIIRLMSRTFRWHAVHNIIVYFYKFYMHCLQSHIGVDMNVAHSAHTY